MHCRARCGKRLGNVKIRQIAGKVYSAVGERLIALWDPAARAQARTRLVAVTRGLLFQRLVPTPNGKGRTASAELLRTLPLMRPSSCSRSSRGRSSPSPTSSSARA